MAAAEDIAQASWTYGTRTLATGTPGAPVTRLDLIAQVVWTYTPRPLTGAAFVQTEINWVPESRPTAWRAAARGTSWAPEPRPAGWGPAERGTSWGPESRPTTWRAVRR